MNQTIPPPPKGYRVITEDERKALFSAGKMIRCLFRPDPRGWTGERLYSFNSEGSSYAIRYDEWIPWAGKDYCPLPVGTKVDVRLKNGNEEATIVEAAEGCNMTDSGFWARDNSIFAITAYRVHDPERVNENKDAEDSLAMQILNNHLSSKPFYSQIKYDFASGPDLSAAQFGCVYTLHTPQQKQQTNENTMATTTADSTLGYSLPSTLYAIPEIGSTWAFEWINRTRIAKIVSASHDAICFKDKGGDIQIVTASAWHSLAKTPIKTRKELKQMAKQNRPGNIIVKTGGSRKRWFLIGAAAMYVGKPFIPAAAYHVMQFINSIL